MKHLIICIIVVGLFGCKGFLDEIDQDLLRPTKIDHYASLLLNECTLNAPYFRGVHHMTDDVSESSLTRTSKKKYYQNIYTWRREIEIDENGLRVSNNMAWADMYRSVAILNDVLLEIDQAAGTPEEVAAVKGEAYFLRGLAYFNLVNLYAEPYVPGKASTQLGVPLRLDHGIEQTYDRDYLEICYNQIEKDVTDALEEYKKTDIVNTKWHPNAVTCELLLSRIKLYKQEWEETVDYASRVIEVTPLTKLSDKEPFVRNENPEILYSFIYNVRLLNINHNKDCGFATSESLLSSYDEENDIRRKAFFADKGDARQMLTYSQKAEPTYTELGACNMRGAEAYLNRAEAYVKLDNITAAQEDMKSLVAKRYRDPAKVIIPSAKEELLQFILDERRREFCWEDHHRWFDLRRMENRPEIRHVFTYVDENDVPQGKEAYRLLKADPNYVLSIPLAERDNNPMIVNNDRLEKVAEPVN